MKVWLVGLGTAVLLVAGIPPALAGWTAHGTGKATTRVAAFVPPHDVTAEATGGQVTIRWSAARLSTGQKADGYYVTRIGSGPACDAKPITKTHCKDDAPDGSHRYRVVAIYRGWTATSAATSLVTIEPRRAPDPVPPPSPSPPPSLPPEPTPSPSTSLSPSPTPLI